MDTILSFLADNYIWFLVISLILIFALIGYLVDTKKDSRFYEKQGKDVDLQSRLDAAQAANITLNQVVKQQAMNPNAQGQANASQPQVPQNPVAKEPVAANNAVAKETKKVAKTGEPVKKEVASTPAATAKPADNNSSK